MTTYSKTTPPFNFLGNLTETQKNVFSSWVSAHTSNFSAYQEFYQIRAQKLRKTAGFLDKFYSTYHTEALSTTFQKDPWTPSENGHFTYNYRDDHQPMVIISEVKKLLKEPLNRQDEGVFFMNHVRRIIEKNEDLAQHASEAPTKLKDLINKINFLFDQPQYEATLIKDTSNTYKGVQKFRTSQLDPPTPWELDSSIGLGG